MATLAVGLSLSLRAVPAAHADEGPTTHKVSEGQSLWKIAKRYNISVAAIQKANALDEDAPIQPGVVLKIPSRADAKKLEAAPAPPKKAAATREKEKEKTRAKEEPEAAKPAEDPAVRGPWWAEKPSDDTQTQKTPEERGGVNPCLTKDPGWGIYDGWVRSPSIGQMTMPGRGGVTKSGAFDVVFHFHGHEPARKEFVKVMDGAVLVGIDLGIGSGAYSSAFSSPGAFKDLLASVERGVAEARGIPQARARKIALSAWSAGYGAVDMILRQPLGQRVDTVLLVDSVHAGYGPDGTVNPAQMEPFLDFARKAKAGQKIMFMSHSSIIPPGYASTTETANFLIMKLGGKAKAASARKSDPMGLELNSKWDAGGFHVRGYDGNDKMDHCAHFGVLKDALRIHLKPRWQSPKGLAARNKAHAAGDKAQAPTPQPSKPQRGA